jgi:hypothetical protein
MAKAESKFLRDDPNRGRVRVWSTFKQKFVDEDPLEVALCALVDNEGRLNNAGLRPGTLGEICQVLRTILDGDEVSGG